MLRLVHENHTQVTAAHTIKDDRYIINENSWWIYHEPQHRLRNKILSKTRILKYVGGSIFHNSSTCSAHVI